MTQANFAEAIPNREQPPPVRKYFRFDKEEIDQFFNEISEPKSEFYQMLLRRLSSTVIIMDDHLDYDDLIHDFLVSVYQSVLSKNAETGFYHVASEQSFSLWEEKRLCLVKYITGAILNFRNNIYRRNSSVAQKFSKATGAKGLVYPTKIGVQANDQADFTSLRPEDLAKIYEGDGETRWVEFNNGWERLVELVIDNYGQVDKQRVEFCVSESLELMLADSSYYVVLTVLVMAHYLDSLTYTSHRNFQPDLGKDGSSVPVANKMPESYLKVVCYPLLGWTDNEIAEYLGIGTNVVYLKKFRAKKWLSDHLDDQQRAELEIYIGMLKLFGSNSDRSESQL